MAAFDDMVMRLMAHARTTRSRIRMIDDADEKPGGTGIRVSTHVKGSRRVVRFRRPPHASEGTDDREIEAEFDQARDTGIQEIDLLDDLLRREVAIRANDYTIEKPPSWSLTADAATMAFLGTIGLPVRETLNPMDGAWTRGTDGYKLPMECRTRRIEGHVGRSGPTCSLKMMVYADQTKDMKPGVYAYDDLVYRFPRIDMICRETLPSTAMTAAIGRPLSEVVMLPGVACNSIIREMDCSRNSGNGFHYLHISLLRQTMPLLTAPPGVDTDWLRIHPRKARTT